ncbi:MAG: hypothetical protein JKY26_06610 [Pseudomonas sp.]|nr:hypothetical protein [Pseudomonas sp.]
MSDYVDHRMQLELRDSVDRLLGMGYEVVSRSPLKLTRVGCRQGWIQQHHYLVETRELLPGEIDA